MLVVRGTLGCTKQRYSVPYLSKHQGHREGHLMGGEIWGKPRVQSNNVGPRGNHGNISTQKFTEQLGDRGKAYFSVHL